MPIPEIPGVKADRTLADGFRGEVAQLLGRRSLSFPGAQPVSFARKHLRELVEHDYYLCEKTDGIRCLLYCTNDGPNEIHYLIDRKNDYYYVPGLHFPRPEDPTFGAFHTGTIIDGELVYDQEEDGLHLRFLVFDCLAIDGKPQIDRQLDKRLAYFKDFVYKPWEMLFKKKHPDELKYQPFEIEFKEMSFPYVLSWMFEIKVPKLKHGNDGLIFTCKETPYVFGTDEKILKWKPAHENTVDFRLKLGEFPPLLTNGSGGAQEPDYDAKPTFDLYVFCNKGEYRNFGSLYVSDEEWDIMKSIGQQLDGRIIECYKDPQGNWRFKRDDSGKPHFRDDKHEANHISTVESVLESIEDAVSQEDLIRNEQRIRDAFKKRQAEREIARKRHEEEQARRFREEKRKRESIDADGMPRNGEPADKRIKPE